ncbi:hypothetical protein H0H92_010628 [Tricholoma furcatifolium]|nr:hypothetical protein H0H92_010628 [Tricholoma furcatifolium]
MDSDKMAVDTATSDEKAAPPPPVSASIEETSEVRLEGGEPAGKREGSSGGIEDKRVAGLTAELDALHSETLNNHLKIAQDLIYLEAVKAQFSDQSTVYNQFLDIMKEFRSKKIDALGVIKRVSQLFNGHPLLIQNFNTFLPIGYRIECSDDYNGSLITVTTPSGRQLQTTNNGGKTERYPPSRFGAKST